jgi:hypothetical protein
LHLELIGSLLALLSELIELLKRMQIVRVRIQIERQLH